MRERSLSEDRLRRGGNPFLRLKKFRFDSPHQNGQSVRFRPASILSHFRRSLLRPSSPRNGIYNGIQNGGEPVSLTINALAMLDHSNSHLTNVHIEIDPTTVHLFGSVKSYRALQIVTRVAQDIASGRRIDLDVDVVPGLYEEGTL